MRSLGFPFFFLLCNYCTSGCKESCQHWHWHKIGFMHLWMHFSLYITVMAWVYMFAKTSPIMCLWAMLIQFYSAECFPIHSLIDKGAWSIVFCKQFIFTCLSFECVISASLSICCAFVIFAAKKSWIPSSFHNLGFVLVVFLKFCSACSSKTWESKILSCLNLANIYI